MSVEIFIEGKVYEDAALNYANANFARLWELIGFGRDVSEGEIAVKDLEAFVKSCMKSLNVPRDLTRPEERGTGAKGCKYISMEDSDERMRDRIRQVMQMAIEARRRGKRIIFA